MFLFKFRQTSSFEMLEKVNKKKRWLYSSPLWKDNCSEKRFKLTPKRTKVQEFPIFIDFIPFWLRLRG